MTIGVAAVIILVAVGNGSKQAVQACIAALGGLGFFGGVKVQKRAGGETAGGGTAARTAGGPPGLGGASANEDGSSQQQQQSVASGEVTTVDGDVLTVTTSDGTTVKVEVAEEADVVRTADSSASRVHPGDTVVVVGEAREEGMVSATSVTATAEGVSAAGGFGGGPPAGMFGQGGTSSQSAEAIGRAAADRGAWRAPGRPPRRGTGVRRRCRS